MGWYTSSICIFVMMLFLNQTTTSSDLVFFVFEFQDLTDFVIRDRHKEKGHLMKNMVFPKLGTEEYRKLYCCYTNPMYSYITPNKPRLQHNYMYIFTTNRVINTYVLECEQTRKIFFVFL